MKGFWKKGEYVKWITFQTNNIIIRASIEDIGFGYLFIIGNGHSMSLDSDGRIKTIEPFMHKPNVYKKFKPFDTVMEFYFTFECEGLEAAARDLAEFLNSDFVRRRFTKIYLVGHSKCGVCFYNAVPMVNQAEDLYLVTISSPFRGTVMASNGFREMPKKFNGILNLIHKAIFSDHPVDRDITPGSDFLKSLPSEEEVLQNCKRHLNFCSTLDNVSLFECRGLQSKFCKFLQWATGIEDGIVPIESQIVEKGAEQVMVFSAHTSSLDICVEICLYSSLLS